MRTRAAGVAAGAAILVLTACGGSDGKTTATTVKTTGTTRAPATAAASTTVAGTTTVAATAAAATTVATTATPTTTGYRAEPATGALSKGMKGNRVAGVQTKLRALGYDPGPADGLFGEKTEAAAKKFQSDQKLQIDGVVGPQTLGALDTACKSKNVC